MSRCLFMTARGIFGVKQKHRRMGDGGPKTNKLHSIQLLTELVGCTTLPRCREHLRIHLKAAPASISKPRMMIAGECGRLPTRAKAFAWYGQRSDGKPPCGSRSLRPGLYDAACSSRAPIDARGRRALAARHGLDPETISGWRRHAADAPSGRTWPRSAPRTEAEGRVPQPDLPPLDGVLSRPRDTIPRLTRSASQRCLVRRDISRSPRDEKASKRGRFAETAIGYVRIDARELHPVEGKPLMPLAIDRAFKSTLGANNELIGAAWRRFPLRTQPASSHPRTKHLGGITTFDRQTISSIWMVSPILNGAASRVPAAAKPLETLTETVLS